MSDGDTPTLGQGGEDHPTLGGKLDPKTVGEMTGIPANIASTEYALGYGPRIAGPMQNLGMPDYTRAILADKLPGTLAGQAAPPLIGKRFGLAWFWTWNYKDGEARVEVTGANDNEPDLVANFFTSRQIQQTGFGVFFDSFDNGTGMTTIEFIPTRQVTPKEMRKVFKHYRDGRLRDHRKPWDRVLIDEYGKAHRKSVNTGRHDEFYKHGM